MDIRDQLLEQAANSVGDMLRRRVAETPNVRAFMYPQGTAVPTNWVTLTWKQTSDIVDQLAAGLLSRGLGYEERVAICSNTRIEWILVDLAIAAAAGATTTVYPTTGADDVHYVLSDSGSVILVAEDAAQVEKIGGFADLAEQILEEAVSALRARRASGEVIY